MKKPEAMAFKEELSLIAKNLEKAQTILERFGKEAKEQKMDAILFHATAFLSFS